MRPVKLTPQRITPDDAYALMQTQHNGQRKVSSAWVKILSARIRHGEWDPHAGIICVDDSGQLTDGGHRCAAIHASGCDVMAIVACMPWSTYRDDVRRRSCADRNMVSKHVAAVSRIDDDREHNV